MIKVSTKLLQTTCQRLVGQATHQEKLTRSCSLPLRLAAQKSNVIFRFLVFSLSLFVVPAEAAWYTDCSICAQKLGGDGVAGPFQSEDACDNFKSTYPNNTYPYGDCYSKGDDANSSASGNGDLVNESSQLIVGGMMHNDGGAVGMGLMGMAASILLSGSQPNPQLEAQRRAEAAAQAAEARRQAEARARQRERIKQELLGTAPDSNDSTGGLHLMGVTQEPKLALMTTDQALAPMIAAHKKIKHSDAFNKGYHDASQCYQQHPITACAGIQDSNAYLTCRSDYFAGYDVGVKKEKMKLNTAQTLGKLDALSGNPNDGFKATDNSGDCRVQLIEAYNRGYGLANPAKNGANSN